MLSLYNAGAISNRKNSTAFQITLDFANDSVGIRELDLDDRRPNYLKEDIN